MIAANDLIVGVDIDYPFLFLCRLPGFLAAAGFFVAASAPLPFTGFARDIVSLRHHRGLLPDRAGASRITDLREQTVVAQHMKVATLGADRVTPWTCGLHVQIRVSPAHQQATLMISLPSTQQRFGLCVSRVTHPQRSLCSAFAESAERRRLQSSSRA